MHAVVDVSCWHACRTCNYVMLLITHLLLARAGGRHVAWQACESPVIALSIHKSITTVLVVQAGYGIRMCTVRYNGLILCNVGARAMKLHCMRPGTCMVRARHAYLSLHVPARIASTLCTY